VIPCIFSFSEVQDLGIIFSVCSGKRCSFEIVDSVAEYRYCCFSVKGCAFSQRIISHISWGKVQ